MFVKHNYKTAYPIGFKLHMVKMLLISLSQLVKIMDDDMKTGIEDYERVF